MVFDTKLSKSKSLNDMYVRAMNELRDWYEIDWREHVPKLFVIEDKETFIGMAAGQKKEDWVRGFGDFCNNIFVYSPEAQEKYTIHKYNKEDYYRFIKHELDHSFFYMYTKGLRYPKWLVEGHAGYVTDQIKYTDPIVKFEKFLEMDKSIRGDGYSESGCAVKLLIEKVGKEEFLSFLSELSQKDFQKEFTTVFDMPLSYEAFNLLLYQL